MVKFILIASLVLVLVAFGVRFLDNRGFSVPFFTGCAEARTVDEVVARYGEAAESRLTPRFEAAGATYPPAGITLIGLKEEKRLELWVREDNRWRFVHSYRIKAASGRQGPKLREGDRQVPEGVYRIVALNPNSRYHLSLKLDYPNAFDLEHAQADGRHEPGSNIFIHGKAVSIGCLAMGDEAIEELFVLVAKVGRRNVKVLLSPYDARHSKLVPDPVDPPWTTRLYETIEGEFSRQGFHKSED